MTFQNQSSRLSVLLITYNHEMYIDKCVQSILFQKMNEPYTIIVADDGSTDNTIDIIKSYSQINPHIEFNFLDYSENRGITQNYKRAFSALRSEYVAIMEGDDYWVNPYKLAHQLKFLDEHWECNLCSVNYYVYEMDRCQFTPRTPVGTGYSIFGARDLINDNIVGNFSTCMYRSEALIQLPNRLYDLRSYDWVVNICVAQNGLIAFLKEPMSVYRIHQGGVWSLLSKSQKLKDQLELIPAYDSLTKGVFHADFESLTSKLRRDIAKCQLQNIALPFSSRLIQFVPHLIDFTPPIVLSLFKLFLPPSIKRYVLARLFKGRI